MTIERSIYLILAVVAIIVFMYVVLPRIKLNQSNGKLIRLILFVVMMLVLLVDLFRKEMYLYMLVVSIGSIGFLLMLKDSKKK